MPIQETSGTGTTKGGGLLFPKFSFSQKNKNFWYQPSPEKHSGMLFLEFCSLPFPEKDLLGTDVVVSIKGTTNT